MFYFQLDVTPMVQDAKKVASNIRDQPSIGKWRDSNQKLLDSVGKVRKAVAGPEPIPDVSALNLSKKSNNAVNFFNFYLTFVCHSDVQMLHLVHLCQVANTPHLDHHHPRQMTRMKCLDTLLKPISLFWFVVVVTFNIKPFIHVQGF